MSITHHIYFLKQDICFDKDLVRNVNAKLISINTITQHFHKKLRIEKNNLC